MDEDVEQALRAFRQPQEVAADGLQEVDREPERVAGRGQTSYGLTAMSKG